MNARKKIVLIDDDKEICDLAKSIFERTGRYEVAVSTKATEAVSLVKFFQPDIVLLDVLMKEKDGTTIAQELSHDEKTHAIPVVFLTAIGVPMAFFASMVGSDSVEQTADHIGGHHIIQKPVTGQELVRRIDAILAELKPKNTSPRYPEA
jgi:CheY-like chemotaxis protein